MHIGWPGDEYQQFQEYSMRLSLPALRFSVNMCERIRIKMGID